MPRSLVALGSNLGDRRRSIERAVELLSAHPEITAVRASQPHQTPPIGGAPGQGQFLNAAVSFETTLAPEAVHALLTSVERSLGRQRGARWDARTIDLDLLLYGSEVIDTESLVVPHPRMAWRRFVLEPAAEVAAEMTHPTIGWTVGQLLEHLDAAIPYVAFLGLPGSGKTRLAQRVAADLGGRFLPDPLSAASAGPVDGTAGPLLERQIQFLDRRKAVLDRATWTPGGVLAVSDYYFDQALAYARVSLAAAELAVFTEAWQVARAQVVLPKLLIVLDTPPAARAEQPASGSPAGPALRDELLRLAARRDIGPVLYAGGVEPAAQFDEIVAAIQAMQ